MDIRKITLINPAPYNPRIDLQQGDPEYEKLKHSIAEFGYVERLFGMRRQDVSGQYAYFWRNLETKCRKIQK
ncbi:hypothetical protein [Aneurinibacillus terranovensis]|uniref:hypothetical protein n=1 Tax=Aneurinibacillus terranovensis TaxID=278991 RepID=UPI0004151299|nr:hypothetical protein [Aneurinibacillus terranovensis]